MSTELITIIVTIISASIALAALGLGLFAWLRQDMKEQGQRHSKELAEQGQKHSKELAEQGKEIEAVKKEIAGVSPTEIGEVKIEVASLKATRGNLLPGPGGSTTDCSRCGAPRRLRRGLTPQSPSPQPKIRCAIRDTHIIRSATKTQSNPKKRERGQVFDFEFDHRGRTSSLSPPSPKSGKVR